MKHGAVITVALAILACTTGAPRQKVASSCDTGAAVDAILREFESHRLVLLGEQHKRKEFHDFLKALVSDPRLARRVNDVVVEFGNAGYQDVMDRYIAGEDVDLAELRPAWRDTTQLLVWDSPLYEEFFRSVRDLNRTLAPERRLRVLLGDPPINWSTVTDKESYGRFAERDANFTEVTEREVISRGRSALLIIGGMHVPRTARGEPVSAHPGVGDLLHQKHQGLTSAIFTIPPNKRLSLGSECVPALIPASREIGDLSFGDLMPPGIMEQRMIDGERKWIELEADDWPRVREKVDAILWLGDANTLVEPPDEVFRDREYLRELHRRARIMSDFFGFDMTSDLPPLPPT